MTVSSCGAGGRAIGYLRVSTAGQEERGSSLATQRERVREYAAEQGLDPRRCRTGVGKRRRP